MEGDYTIDILPKENTTKVRFSFQCTVNAKTKVIKYIKIYFSNYILNKFPDVFYKKNDNISSSQFLGYSTEIRFSPYGNLFVQ